MNTSYASTANVLTQQIQSGLALRMSNTIRMLSADAVEQAKSGHPGAPMGMADMAYVLWAHHMRHDPREPNWFNRDRFVLSNGHASMLIYALLHLTGYELSIEDLKQFRQLHSKTPGHPEVGVTPGVETTTGPLGQGLANAVGMAFAEKQLAAQFNQMIEGQPLNIVDHHTYVFLGDGCLMEGISHEVCSLAGTLRLSKLIALYDDNGISIDGDVAGWFTDDTPMRFKSYGWHVIEAVDGHDMKAIDQAISQAKSQSYLTDGKPTLICCRTRIGQGAPNKAGGHDVHGAPLGADELAATRQALNWPYPAFEVPADIKTAWSCRDKGYAQRQAWQHTFDQYRLHFPTQAVEFERRMRGQLPQHFTPLLDVLRRSQCLAMLTPIATRRASQCVLDVMAEKLPELFGGSADLTGSNLTNPKNMVRALRDQAGNHLSYGVREFGMAAIMNGIALHRGLIPYGGTFLTFSDYSRNAIRMAALMRIRVIHVFTHDSIGLGEDGPTHQSIEQVPSLRLMPNLDMWRPADLVETWAAWHTAIERQDGPSALALSRQSLPRLVLASEEEVEQQWQGAMKGGYILADYAVEEKSVTHSRLIILATGSETHLAIEAFTRLKTQGIACRVVSMPCTNLFDRQPTAYQNHVLPKDWPAIAIEAAQPDFWHKYVGRHGKIFGMPTYGESAPATVLYKHFGLTVEALVQAAQESS
jgi:transketolase